MDDRNSETPRAARQMFAVRLSDDERETVRRAAKRKGVPLSTYLRDAGVKSARRDLKKAA